MDQYQVVVVKKRPPTKIPDKENNIVKPTLQERKKTIELPRKTTMYVNTIQA